MKRYQSEEIGDDNEFSSHVIKDSFSYGANLKDKESKKEDKCKC
jgi:hypothetical protein